MKIIVIRSIKGTFQAFYIIVRNTVCGEYISFIVKSQVKELLTKYGKIGLIWFDTPYNMPKELSAFPYEICVVGLKSKARRVYLLKTGEELLFFQSYEIAWDEYRFRVMFPSEVADSLDTVAVVGPEEKPEVQGLMMKRD